MCSLPLFVVVLVRCVLLGLFITLNTIQNISWRDNTFYTVVEFSFSFYLAPSRCPCLLLLNIDDGQAANGITLIFVRPSMHHAGLRLSSWNWNRRTWKTAKYAVCTAAEFLANRTHMATAFHQSLTFK